MLIISAGVVFFLYRYAKKPRADPVKDQRGAFCRLCGLINKLVQIFNAAGVVFIKPRP
jgi:hypothetical protein